MNTIDFMGQRRLAFLFSGILILLSLGSLATRQLNWGLDFTGGTLVEVHYSDTADLTAVRDILATEGYEGAIVVSFGTDQDVLIRLPLGYSDEQGVALLRKLQEAYEGTVELRRIEFVGPQVGDELREQGGLALLLALGLVMLYIGFRFQFKFAVGAVAALIHDVLVTLAALSVTHREINLPTIAAMLTLVGYSVNDTVVVFDRVRENLRLRRGEDLEKLMNSSINQTLSRTLITSGTTLIVVISLYVFGGDVINTFAFVLLVGVIVGTYSTVFIASPVALWVRRLMNARRERRRRKGRR